MIRPAIDDARVKHNEYGWCVLHPCNDAILAYCDTEAEAKRYRDYLNDAALHLRQAGEKCA